MVLDLRNWAALIKMTSISHASKYFSLACYLLISGLLEGMRAEHFRWRPEGPGPNQFSSHGLWGRGPTDPAREYEALCGAG